MEFELEPMTWDAPIPVAQPMENMTIQQAQALLNLQVFRTGFPFTEPFDAFFEQRIRTNHTHTITSWCMMGQWPHCNWCGIPFLPTVLAETGRLACECSPACRSMLHHIHSPAASDAAPAPSTSAEPESAGEGLTALTIDQGEDPTAPEPNA